MSNDAAARKARATKAASEPAAAACGRLVVLSGPAGSGKTTVAERLCREAGLRRVVTATTRAPRPGEAHGRDYLFLSEDEFRRRLARGEFLEHALVHGKLYGTPLHAVTAALEAGERPLLVIDVQGAMQVKQKCPDALLLFLDAPDAALRKRLARRGTEGEAERRRRFEAAVAERKWKEHYDYCVVNDDLGRTMAELRTLLGRSATPHHRRHSLDG